MADAHFLTVSSRLIDYLILKERTSLSYVETMDNQKGKFPMAPRVMEVWTQPKEFRKGAQFKSVCFM